MMFSGCFLPYFSNRQEHCQYSLQGLELLEDPVTELMFNADYNSIQTTYSDNLRKTDPNIGDSPK
jgi:hypothetical protein